GPDDDPAAGGTAPPSGPAPRRGSHRRGPDEPEPARTDRNERAARTRARRFTEERSPPSTPSTSAQNASISCSLGSPAPKTVASARCASGIVAVAPYDRASIPAPSRRVDPAGTGVPRSAAASSTSRHPPLTRSTG